MLRRPPKVFLSTGESSGDLHAANLIRSLRRLRPDVECTGLGGHRMEEAGCRLQTNLLGMAAMWHKAATGALRVVPVLARADRSFAADPPDVVVVMDYPGFNFPLARRASSRGIPVLWYIPPQMWAWGRWRMGKLGRRVSRVACIFPFEEDMYRQAGIPVRYVGHPLMDELAGELDAPPREPVFGAGRPRLGIMPGSRKQEVETLLPVMLQVAAAVRTAHPAAQFTVARANPTLGPLLGEILGGPLGRAVPGIRVIEEQPYELMRQSDLLLVKSGTSTLEAALFGTPMLILYHVSPVLRFLARQLLKSPHIGLANVVAGRTVVPEYAPGLPPVQVIIDKTLELLGDPAKLAAVRADLADVRRRIGPPGASDRVAEEVLDLAAGSQSRHRDGLRRGSAGIVW